MRDGTGTARDLLLVEADDAVAGLIEAHLANLAPDPIRIVRRSTLKAALELLDRRTVDVALVDMELADAAGLEGVRRIRAAVPDLPLVALTRQRAHALGVAAVRGGAHDFLVRETLDLPILARTLRYAIERSRERRRMRQIVSASDQGMLVISAQDVVLFVNPAAVVTLGRTEEELVGSAPPFPTRVGVTHDLRMPHRDGSDRAVEVRVSSTEWEDRPARLAYLRDTTARMEAERSRREQADALRRLQKMEALTVLAGGVAHDFNNLITVVRGRCELALHRIERGQNVSEDIRFIERASGRAAVLTRQLLAFSRREPIQPKAVSVSELLGRMEPVIESLMGESTRVRFDLDPESGEVGVDPGLIEQAVINLVVNAHEAMPDGGDLLIEVAAEVIDEAASQLRPGTRAGHYVALSLTDSGPGVPPEIVADIFEPFFTTKKSGRSSGLGLTTVYGIAKESGGNIWCLSEVGNGATFKLLLPCAGSDAPEKPTGDDAAADKADARAEETVLLVEDQEDLRVMTREMLRGAGYEVLEARNAREALAVGRDYSGEIDVLLTDVVMPGMDGNELAKRLAAARPTMAVVFMSGYPRRAAAQPGGLDARAAFLAKPFTMFELTSLVRTALD